MPFAFGAAMFLAVVTYACLTEEDGAGNGMAWLPILAGAYVVNVITVPYLGRNLVEGRHVALTFGYSIQLLVLGAVVIGFGPSPTSLAAGVLARSAVDFAWQWRLTQVGHVVLH
jgi:hypothetical protein